MFVGTLVFTARTVANKINAETFRHPLQRCGGTWHTCGGLFCNPFPVAFKPLDLDQSVHSVVQKLIGFLC